MLAVELLLTERLAAVSPLLAVRVVAVNGDVVRPFSADCDRIDLLVEIDRRAARSPDRAAGAGASPAARRAVETARAVAAAASQNRDRDRDRTDKKLTFHRIPSLSKAQGEQVA